MAAIRVIGIDPGCRNLGFVVAEFPEGRWDLYPKLLSVKTVDLGGRRLKQQDQIRRLMQEVDAWQTPNDCHLVTECQFRGSRNILIAGAMFALEHCTFGDHPERFGCYHAGVVKRSLGITPATYKQNKAAVKDWAQKLYPEHKWTDHAADALALIVHHAKQQQQSGSLQVHGL